VSSLFKKKPLACLCVEIFDVMCSCPLNSYISLGAQAYGCSEEQLEAAVSKHWADLELGKLKPEPFWERVGEELRQAGVEHNVPGWKFKGIWDGIVADNLKLNAEMMKTVRQAKDAKIRTVACTNMIAEVAAVMQKSGVFEPFNMAVISSQITMRKPSPQVFSRLSKLARFSPSQCLYLDKDPVNLEAARAAGFKVLAYADDPQDTRWQLLQMGLLG
jgi:HAD superfamily hydrolase (TIGR01509 family)